MAADVIDQLVITLGLDSTELGVRLKEVEALLNQNGASLIEFLEGFEQGLVEGIPKFRRLFKLSKMTGERLLKPLAQQQMN